MELVILILLAVAIIGVYWLPTFVANARAHHNRSTILVLNLFLGWTFIGWVVALAMAFSYTRGQAIERGWHQPRRYRRRQG